MENFKMKVGIKWVRECTLSGVDLSLHAECACVFGKNTREDFIFNILNAVYPNEHIKLVPVEDGVIQNKLGLEPAFPREHELNFNANGYERAEQDGVSARLYVAKGYADIAYKIAEETKVSAALDILGLDSNVEWDYAVHLPALIVKLQYMLADEFLKQENNG